MLIRKPLKHTKGDSLLATAHLIKNGCSEDIELPLIHVEPIDRRLVNVGMHGEDIDICWPACLCSRSVRGSIPADLGSYVEANA